MILKGLLLSLGLASAVTGLTQTPNVAFNSTAGAVPLVAQGKTATVLVNEYEWPGVVRAIDDFAADFGRVSGSTLAVRKGYTNSTVLDSAVCAPDVEAAVIVGTLGRSAFIGELIAAGKINVSAIDGEWETYQTQVVADYWSCGKSALVIVGSDRRGTIYGLYDISEQIGVSPWYFFADVAPKKHSAIYALPTTKTAKTPSVKYRGLFINDEEPALTNWMDANYPTGPYGSAFIHEFYEHVFELILRLRGNMLWPAMWNSMFGVDDDKNQYTADMYGVVMSTSHTEPLMRATNEWTTFGVGDWSYSTNAANVTEFWKVGIQRSKPYDNLWTVGMRGNGDTAMSAGVETTLLETVVANQRELLAEGLGVNETTVPQVWCLYKEVQAYYQDGMTVPDDVTLLWADDNWGNARRLPAENETDRSGGSGIYYHFDYVGDPRDYKWINTIQLERVWEQLHLTYERQARQVWIVNVGDLKPLELPIDYFMSLAYDFDTWGPINKVLEYQVAWATREFGATYAKEIATVMDKYGMLAARRKYELIDPSTYSVINEREAETVLDEWKTLVESAKAIYGRLPADYQASYMEMVLHPATAGYIVHNIYITTARNNLYAHQRRSSTNTLMAKVLELFNDDHELKLMYHSLLDGKWNHMMDQTHLGYTYWQQPMLDTLPPLAYVQALDNSLAGSMGIATEASNGSIPGDDYYNAATYSNSTIVMAQLDPFSSPQSRWVDVFLKGTDDFTWTFSPLNEWVTVTPSTGFMSAANASDVRVEVAVDWDLAPEGYNIAYINITSSASYGNFHMPTLHLPINKTSIPDSFAAGFVETSAHISIEAEHATRNSSTSDAEYVVIENYGRTLSGVTLFPVSADSQSTADGPCLEYDLYLFTVPEYGANVTVYTSPTLNINPYRPLKYAIALDDDEPQVNRLVVDAADPLDMPATWTEGVQDNVWVLTTNHNFTEPGEHTLKLWALEPAVVFQKIVIDLGGVAETYLGPPETYRL
ncbi:uncharacterized protein V1510DRAFT_219005 [Dipodascopsis tothii]|uniref:uncharacterized protein n=1 Tax=Dipodascopsis tothii TaxID=44089 RepID=UPI0034CE261A